MIQRAATTHHSSCTTPPSLEREMEGLFLATTAFV
jgi:hypothetical protein